MPIDLLVPGFVVAGFAAVILRFAPRDAGGRRRLPQAIDDSVGMFTIRRLLGRPTDVPDEPPEAFTVVPTPREVAYRIGADGASRPSVRVRPTLAIDDVAPQVQRPAPTATDLIRARSRLNPGLRLQRRLAAALVLLLVAAVVVALVAASSDARGGVLAATGTPGLPANSGAALPSGGPSSSIDPSAPGPAATTEPAPYPSAGETARTTARPEPTRTPRVTPRPTAKPTPSRPPAPTPTPTAVPTPDPTPDPSPSPSASPPFALITCDVTARAVTCSGAGSERAETYTFVFEAGPTVSGGSSVASHTYDDAGTYTITLTVTDAFGRSDAASTEVAVS